jgi:hypothetical protein
MKEIPKYLLSAGKLSRLQNQFMSKDLIALFEFEMTQDGISVVSEKHYRLVDPAELSPEDLRAYRNRTE